MYKIGDYIIYGNSGVCKVVDYMQPDDMEGKQTYYVLSPLSARGSTIFSPVDNQKVYMRPVISREEAEALLEGIPDYEDMEIVEVRAQEQQYKDIIKNYDCTEFLRFIKALYERKKSREAIGRKITALDEKYLILAKGSLLNELSIALDMEVDEVDQLLADRILSAERQA
ncbi:MAG: CarD family transcriptional regulator [Eubacterium sp.]|nr:CarD family transcriptional regulator [Eubacterium sp.]